MLDWLVEGGTTDLTISIDRPPRPELTPDQVAAVKAELTAILGSESFAASRRCRDFLECVVELCLAGEYDSLTERFLGVKLFNRAVDYETATDSIVRVRANDVRRRLTQYYSDRRHDSMVRIGMSAGGYVPEFHWHAAVLSIADELQESPSQQAASLIMNPLPPGLEPEREPGGPTSDRIQSRPWWRSRVPILSSLVVLCAVSVLFSVLRAEHSSAFDAFWQPVIDATGQPVLDLPTTDTFQLTMNPKRTLSPLGDLQPGQTFTLTTGDFIGFHDWHVSLPVLQAMLSVALALDHQGKAPLVRVGTDLRRDELRGHAIIAIGSFSNPWIEEKTNGLRFTFDRGASDREVPRIRDSQNPQRSWSLPHTYPEQQTMDYAIITRTFDPVTREPFVSLAGLHSFGNQIAGEFVSQDSSWREVARRAPRGWQKMNLQILLEADIVGTTPSSPKIVDVYFWQ